MDSFQLEVKRVITKDCRRKNLETVNRRWKSLKRMREKRKGGGRDREDRVFDREEEAAMPRCKFRAKKESDI